MIGNFLNQKQIGKKIGLWMWPIKNSHELNGSSMLSRSKSTHSMRFLTLNPEHWFFSNLSQKIPFKTIKNLFLISFNKTGSSYSAKLSFNKLDFKLVEPFLFNSASSIEFLLSIWLVSFFKSSIPVWAVTASQSDFFKCLFYFNSSILFYKSWPHSFTNFLKSFTFI